MAALTDSGITVFNENAAQGITLKGGQMAQIVKGNIENIYEFDVRSFMETSPLVNDLDLMTIDDSSGGDNPLNQVKREIASAIEAQTPFSDQDVIIENPDFIRLQDNASDGFPDLDVEVVNVDLNNVPQQAVLERMGTVVNLTNLREAGEIQAVEAIRNDNAVTGGDFPGGGATGGDFPGGGATGGDFPGGGATGGDFPGGGATGGDFPGGGATGGDFPGGGATDGNFPGGGATGGNFPGGGATGGNFPGGGATDGNFPGGGNR
jgi:hypothetical protein